MQPQHFGSTKKDILPPNLHKKKKMQQLSAGGTVKTTSPRSPRCSGSPSPSPSTQGKAHARLGVSERRYVAGGDRGGPRPHLPLPPHLPYRSSRGLLPLSPAWPGGHGGGDGLGTHPPAGFWVPACQDHSCNKLHRGRGGRGWAWVPMGAGNSLLSS